MSSGAANFQARANFLVLNPLQIPNGGHESIPNVRADQLVVIREGTGIIRSERFRKRA
jgi:hypothetical protein